MSCGHFEMQNYTSICILKIHQVKCHAKSFFIWLLQITLSQYCGASYLNCSVCLSWLHNNCPYLCTACGMFCFCYKVIVHCCCTLSCYYSMVNVNSFTSINSQCESTLCLVLNMTCILRDNKKTLLNSCILSKNVNLVDALVSINWKCLLTYKYNIMMK